MKRTEDQQSQAFQPGDRVMNLGGKDSGIPEGTKGTVLGLSPYQRVNYETLWEVEYDGLPCQHSAKHVAGARSETSWFSRESRLALLLESAKRRAA